MELSLVILVALLLDRCLGEVKRFHPLVGFGHVVGLVERLFYADSRWRGAWLCASLIILTVGALSLLFYGLSKGVSDLVVNQFASDELSWFAQGIEWSFSAVLVYFTIAWRSLDEHAKDVSRALRDKDIARARLQAGKILSRDTAALNATGVASATIESVLENGNDAIFGAIFWYCVAGIPGVLCYRLANTLDAMWGYKSARYIRFGWGAARLDDVMNYLPARLSALSYALAGNLTQGMRCWARQAKHWKSVNAGAVMAAGAGSLGLSLGGAAVYHGELQSRPLLGQGETADENDIDRASALLRRSIVIWLLVIALGEAIVYAAV